MGDIDILRKRIERERAARQEAEKLLEERALQLYYANEQLRELNLNLESEIKRKTAELERQKERYQMLVDSAEDIIFVISNDGYFKYVNPIATKIIGYSEEQLKNIHFEGLIDPDYLAEVTRFYQEQIEKQEPISYLEFPIICSDGRKIWIGQNVSLQFVDGEVVELTAIARDISERVDKDKEITQLNLRLSAILRNLQEGILLEDENRKIVLVNQEFCNLFGIPVAPVTLIGTDCSESAEQSKHLFLDPQAFVSQVNDILAARQLVTGDMLDLVDGRIFLRDYIPIFSEGRYIGHLWRYADITQQKKIELQIRQSEEKYRGIIENMELGLMEVDKEGIITKPYQRFCAMTGYRAEELIGRSANEVFLPDAFKEQMLAQDKYRKEGQAGVYEVKMKVKGGNEKWVMISGAPFYNVKGEMVGSIGIHYDISQQKALQRALEDARREAERARDAEKDFLANMSHEIRNPINAIVGMTQLLFDTPLTQEQQEYLNNINYSSEILLALISDILDISKITEGKMEPNLQAFDLSELIKAVANTMQFRLSGKPIVFRCDFDDDIPGPLLSDTTFLNQVLLNLLGNAIKFTHEGEIVLEVKLVKKTKQKAQITFTIRDTGIGIPPDKLGYVFERFNQAGKATSNQYGGTGLGLPITKELVELLQGHIQVKSTVGQGTTFIFSIPFPRLAKGPKSPSLPVTLSPGALAPGALSVLIVEDNPANRLYLERTLEKWNYPFDSCSNGEEALNMLAKKTYNLILMDIRMPVMDGYETAIRLRSSDNPNAQVPIIALTASALTDEKDRALAAGMNFHVTKPFTPGGLQSAIQAIFPTKVAAEVLTAGTFSWPSLLDEKSLDELYGGDLEHAQLIFQLFQEDMPLALNQLGEAIAAGNWAAAAAIAHKIKPHFSMVGREELSLLLTDIESQCIHAKPDSATIIRGFQQLEASMEPTYGAIAEALNRFQIHLKD